MANLSKVRFEIDLHLGAFLAFARRARCAWMLAIAGLADDQGIDDRIIDADALCDFLLRAALGEECLDRSGARRIASVGFMRRLAAVIPGRAPAGGFARGACIFTTGASVIEAGAVLCGRSLKGIACRAGSADRSSWPSR